MFKQPPKPPALLTESQRIDAWLQKREIAGGITIFNRTGDYIFDNWYKDRGANHLSQTILSAKFWPAVDIKLSPDFSPQLQELLEEIWPEFETDAIALTLNLLSVKTDCEVADFLTSFWIVNREKIDWIHLRFNLIRLAQDAHRLTHLPNDWHDWLDESAALDQSTDSEEVKSLMHCIDDVFLKWIEMPGWFVVPGDSPEIEITSDFVNYLFVGLLQSFYFRAQKLIASDQVSNKSGGESGGGEVNLSSVKPTPDPGVSQ